MQFIHPKCSPTLCLNKLWKPLEKLTTYRSLRILDPATGHGELLVSLLEHLPRQWEENIEVCGFETDSDALDTARERIEQQFPSVSIHFESGNFLEFVLDYFGPSGHGNLFRSAIPEAYDLIIANPPYVRTQIMGATQAQLLSEQFGLSGRVDLYYAFILGISQVLKASGHRRNHRFQPLHDHQVWRFRPAGPL